MTLSERWKKLEEGTRRLAAGNRGLWGVGAAAYLESSFIPFPIELMLVPVFLSCRDRIWRIAGAALAGCLLASVTFYGIGLLLYAVIGQPVAAYMGLEADLTEFSRELEGLGLWAGFWVIFGVSFLPLPLQAATLGSGIVGYSFPMFLAAILISRALRFHGLALLTLFLGKPLQQMIDDGSTGRLLAALTAIVVAVLTIVALVFYLT